MKTLAKEWGMPPADAVLSRNLQFISNPSLWNLWPYLPLIRDTTSVRELGVMVDLHGRVGITGFSATVFLTNLFTLPQQLDELLALPKEVFDTAEELIAAGWRVD